MWQPTSKVLLGGLVVVVGFSWILRVGFSGKITLAYKVSDEFFMRSVQNTYKWVILQNSKLFH